MIYFTSYDIFHATIAFFSLGCIFGILYNSFIYIFNFVKKLFALPKITYLKYKKTYIFTEKYEQNDSAVLKQFIDFFVLFLFGVFFILFLYLFLDGEIRIFSFLFALFGYAVSYKIFGAFFSHVINKCLVFILKQTELLVFIILYPVFSIYAIIKKLISPIILLIIKKWKSCRFKRLKYIKLSQIKKIYKKQ